MKIHKFLQGAPDFFPYQVILEQTIWSLTVEVSDETDLDVILLDFVTEHHDLLVTCNYYKCTQPMDNNFSEKVNI